MGRRGVHRSGIAVAAASLVALVAGRAALRAEPDAAAPAVRAWEGTLDLPTYEEGLPDVNPPFDLFETRRFNYPYTLR